MAYWTFSFTLFSLLLAARASAQPAPDSAIVIRDYLVIESVGRYGRNAIQLDPLVSQIVEGREIAPRAGDTMESIDGRDRTWQAAAADADGQLRHAALSGGYAYAAYESPRECVMILHASGHSMVYVNGEPRMGDPYSSGAVLLPIALRAGVNHFLFPVGRGGLSAKLLVPQAEIEINPRDATLPDLIQGETVALNAAIPLMNTTTRPIESITIETQLSDGAVRRSAPFRLAALTCRKVAFPLEAAAGRTPGESPLKLIVRWSDKSTTADLKLSIRAANQQHNRTFISEIDGSVQYYAVMPPESLPTRPTALVLSVHGASVEATSQAGAYAPKSWAYVIAPTNRRPYGFDWEDTGRLDAMEVLDLAQRQYQTDPARTYLTGHSMGGHGTWHLGVTFPDRFAAIAPSAGWISFFSYGGASRDATDDPVLQLLQRATNNSDTLALIANLTPLGVYILHGDADDNVPVAQAREMREKLTAFHRDFQYHEQPGAGHWWESSDERGAECLDWPPIFDMFARRARPVSDQVRDIVFFTANPGVSATCFWATIESQSRPMIVSSVKLRVDPHSRRYSGTTENVASLSLDTSVLAGAGPVSITLDDQKLSDLQPAAGDARICLERAGGTWARGERPAASTKGPHRAGPFKDVFRNRFLLVYGTAGSAAENAWAAAKARYDSEQFWVRGNGSVEVIADRDFDLAAEPHRNVVLYGNADTNVVWPRLFPNCPVAIRPGAASIGGREWKGDDLACLFIRPRPGSHSASVAAVAGTGLSGMKLTDRLPYFTSGVAYPDCTLIGADVHTIGALAVRATGFFGNDWSIERGDFAFRP